MATAGRPHVLVLDRLGVRSLTAGGPDRCPEADRGDRPGGPGDGLGGPGDGIGDPGGRPGGLLDRRRYEVSVITKEALAPGLVEAGVARVIAVPRLATADLLALAADIHAASPLWRVVALSEPQLLPAAAIRERYGLAGMRPEQARWFRDKLAMKRRVASAGLPVPAYEPVTSGDQAIRFLTRHHRAVLKPRLGTGSQGTHLVDSPSALSALVPRLLERGEPYEIEEFVDGPMYHCDGLRIADRSILCVVNRYWQPTLSFTDSGVLASTAVAPSALRDEIVRLNDAVLDALALRNGVTHLEVFAAPDRGLVFCEVAARPGGAGVVPAVEISHGVNLFDAAVRLELGEPVPGAAARGRYAGWVVFHRRPGRVVEVSTPDAFPEQWIHQRQIHVTAGGRMPAARTSVDAAASFVVSAPDVPTLESRVRQVRDRFRLVVAPDQS